MTIDGTSHYSINRNILECKGIFRHTAADTIIVLIETYWNVKFNTEAKERIGIVVLIETYWNVKFTISNGVVAASIDVLIETYWNVKNVDASVIRSGIMY